MKSVAIKSALMAVLATFVLGGVALANNQSYKSGDTVTVAANEVIDRTVFAAGNTLTIAGTVNGDVFCAGKTVFITGTVNGDVFCAGQEVRISGTVNGSVRAAGQSVSIAGTVQRAISLAGQSVSVEPNAKIGGDATLAGSSVVVAGNLARDAYAAGATVTVTGKVARDLDAKTDSLDVAKGSVAGEVMQVKPSREPQKSASVKFPISALKLQILFSLAMFVTAMVLVVIAPQRFDGVAQATLDAFGKTTLIGLAAAVLMPMIIVLLAITVFGIPMAILVALGWAVAGMLAGPVAAYVVGRRLMPQSNKPVATMAYGSVIVLLLYFIPVVNFFVGLAVYLVGLGAVVRSVGSALGKPRYTV